MDEEKIRNEAIEFAKKNKKRIAKELTDIKKYTPDIVPISIFMAGSPGAGKTEFSKNLIKTEEDPNYTIVRIDGDELRELMPGYSGSNSYLFQGAISLIVEKMHDLALHRKQSFVLDGTFTKYDKAVENIQRSLEKDRKVFIFYLYQRPELAWKFTLARELAEGRNIPKPVFIEQFVKARETIEKIFAEFDNKIMLFIVKKDFEKNTEETRWIKKGGSGIDAFIGKRYTKDELEKLL